MDRRATLHVNETFQEILEGCYRSQEKVYLILDENGMVRTEGFIHSIKKHTGDVFVELDNESIIALSKIIAVNGIFRPEYGEC